MNKIKVKTAAAPGFKTFKICQTAPANRVGDPARFLHDYSDGPASIKARCLKQGYTLAGTRQK
jgi:hypothetical protein